MMTSPVETAFALEEVDTDLFRSTKPLWQPPGSRGVYGGAVVAQALSACQKTVPEGFFIHSLHSYFILPGDRSAPVVYNVQRIRDGRSFVTRFVKARQRGRCIFTATCSFQRPADKAIHHQKPAEKPTTPDPTLLAPSLDSTTPYFVQCDGQIMECKRLAEPNDHLPPHERTQTLYMRARGPLKSRELHEMALAYMSDHRFIMTAALANKVQFEDVGMVTSLDHSMYFHCPFRADEWLTFRMSSPWAGDGRGLTIGHVYREDGRLVATCMQEGVIRLRSHL
jgi:acyl-CoA thioesterase II